MKIVLLSHDSNCTGGAQMCLIDLIKGIKTKDHSIQIYLIVKENGTIVDACQQYIDGYEIIPMKWWMYSSKKQQIFKKLKYLIREKIAVAKVSKYLRKIKPDVGVTNSIVMPQLALACKELNIKHVWFIHEIPMLTWPNFRFMYSTQKILRKIDALSALIIAPSDFANRFYQQYITPTKIHTINQAVHSTIGDKVETTRYTLMVVGAMEVNKGQLEMLAAIKKITDAGGDIFCYLVGRNDGLYGNHCKQYIKLNRLENSVALVDFTTTMSEYYYNSDVLVNCSTMECFGRVAVEAQLCGLPVILSEVGANTERVEDGVNGLLYKKGDVDDLVAKIELLRDRKTREQFSKNLKTLGLEKYTPYEFARTFLDALEIKN